MEKVNYILKILKASFVLELMDDAEKMLAKHLLFRQDETLPAIDLLSWQECEVVPFGKNNLYFL